MMAGSGRFRWLVRGIGLLGSAALLLAAAVPSAEAAPIPVLPEVTIDIDGQVFDVGSLGVETELGYQYGAPGSPLVVETPTGDQVSIYLFFDQDPAVTYSIGVTDVGSPSLFSFSFGGAIVSTAGPTQVLGSIGGTLTDPGQNGVAISGLSPNLIQRSFLSGLSDPITNMGVDVGKAFSAPCSGPFPNPTCNLGVVSYPTDTIGFIPGPAQTGPWDNLQVLTAFSLTGGSDTAALSGVARVESDAPEPGILLLLGAGLTALAFRRR